MKDLTSVDAGDAKLQSQAARVERSLYRRLLNGELWLNESDAMLRGLGGY
jgi:hypothetical protein